MEGQLVCGSHGCTTAIFMSSGKTYRKVADLLAFAVELGAGSTGGVRDVVPVGHDGKRRWAWNGRASAPGK